jgi:hypothetical protein
MTYSSYAGSIGTWPTFGFVSSTTDGDQASLSQTNGIIFSIGYPPGNPVTIYGGSHPGQPGIPPVKLANVTDGLSDTIAYSEHAHGLFSQTADSNGITDLYCWNWCVSGNYGDTIFSTLFPMNPQNKLTTGYYEGGTFIQGDDMVTAASSFHPAAPISLFAMARSGSSRRRSTAGQSIQRTVRRKVSFTSPENTSPHRTRCASTRLSRHAMEAK